MLTLFGFIAASLTTFAFIPQVIKTIKTKSTDDLSPVMYGVLLSGVICWLIYGIIINDLPVIVANAVTACLTAIIFFISLKNHLKKKKVIM
ncbi:MAG: SemiSWEET transporter [Bacteroidetes bacterium]|nr:SemiSWEET transporter [Bacteroidota bacterium]MBU1117000.1 SemiSWEET transporter [Bacteroidota bacterium]MBU1797336.1 SemiSWEET transporter [Bacteroidota bacterium]